MDATQEDEQLAPLNVPHAEIGHFGRGYIKFAVCELRFPTLPDLDDARPPPSFLKAVRHTYPHHQAAQTYALGAGDATPTRQHEFRSPNGDWTVSLRQEAVVLQTTNYTTFDDFLARLVVIVEAAEPVIDAPFFTRVGLRYSNRIPFEDGRIIGLINRALVGALSDGAFGAPTEHVGRIVGRTVDGSYVLQHGFKVDEEFLHKPAYAIDCDMSRPNVPIAEVRELLPRLNQHAYNLFYWSLGDKGRDALAKTRK